MANSSAMIDLAERTLLVALAYYAHAKRNARTRGRDVIDLDTCTDSTDSIDFAQTRLHHATELSP